jgi:mono/diheme cytochrome c family protein
MKVLLGVLGLFGILVLSSCRVSGPGKWETLAAKKAKRVTIGGKDWKNPVPDTSEAVKIGGRHFQRHCQVCHGLDGHNSGVPFADRMSPPVADLGGEDIQAYTDGQLKWIIENGIRFTGMPGWDGVLKDDEMWYMVRFMRHLPTKGSLGPPAVFLDDNEHKEMKKTLKVPAK